MTLRSPCAGALAARIAPCPSTRPLAAQSTGCVSTATPPRPEPSSRDVKLGLVAVRALHHRAVGRNGPRWLSLCPRGGSAGAGQHSCLLDVALAARAAIGCGGRRRRPRRPRVPTGVRITIGCCSPSRWLPRAASTQSRQARALAHCRDPERKPPASSTHIQRCSISRCQRSWRPPIRSRSAVPIMEHGARLLNHNCPQVRHDIRLAVHAGRPSARRARRPNPAVAWRDG